MVVLSEQPGNLALFDGLRVSRELTVTFAFRCQRTDMPKPATKKLPSLSVRIDIDSESRIGPGKIQLLESIATCGSISAAGRAMDMSYKRAWDLVDEINRMCGQAAVARQTGGKHGGGATLTAFGTSLVTRYRRIEQAATAAARKDLASLQSDIGRRPKGQG